MRPITITMSAFGSYANEVTVDFTTADHGIFLITGDTGAGKTTIFDAITYALYDRTSGGKRDGQMMRSQYAKEDVPTFVRYTFAYAGKEYTISRSPKYYAKSKRRNKDGEYTQVLQNPTVELIMPDGLAFPGKMKETDNKILEIIGLDDNQFTKIAMIAQGDFMELLHARSDERKAIFARIFNTQIYQQIQESLRARSKKLYGQLEDNRKLCISQMEGVQCVEDSQYQQQWEMMPSFTEIRTEEVQQLLEKITQEAAELEERYHQKQTH